MHGVVLARAQSELIELAQEVRAGDPQLRDDRSPVAAVPLEGGADGDRLQLLQGPAAKLDDLAAFVSRHLPRPRRGRTGSEAQRRGTDDRRVAEDDGELHDVPELARVARPGMDAKRGARVRGKRAAD